MNRRAVTLLLCGCLAIVWMAALSAQAAAGYARANFGFTMPTKLKASVTATTATLDFDKPVSESAASIKASLNGYVKSVTISLDKHKVTLVLLKPYRLRQFASGNTAGIDLIGEPATATQIAAATKKTPPAAVLKPNPSPAKPAPKPTPKPAPKPASATRVTAAIQTTSDADILTTKRATPAADATLTTKRPAPVPVTEPAKPAAPAEARPASTPAASEKPAAITPPPAGADDATSAPSPATDKRPTTTPAPTPVVKPIATKGPLAVTAKTTNGVTSITFPWGERTGATIFKRTRAIWVVFSRAKEVDVSKLRKSMPPNIVNVVQYAYAGNTVLEFVTDGSLYPSADQAKGGYSWNVTIGPKMGAGRIDTSITPDDLEGTTRLILGAYDVAPPLRFYDPDVGDELIIVPSYENGRAVFHERNYPELSVLATIQGIAIVARRHDIATAENRTGVILSAKGGLTISANLPIVDGTAPVTSPSTSGVLMPYEQWFVPRDKYLETEAERLRAISKASKAGKPEALMELVKLYLSQGFGIESSGLLQIIKEQYPAYYTSNKLALLSAAAHVISNHMPEATADLAAPELAALDEAWPWREVVALSTPPVGAVQQIQQAVAAEAAPVKAAANDSTQNLPGPVLAAPVNEKPQFHFLKYNKLYIRYYPPRIRQRLARIAADAYLADGQEEKALAVYDTLMKDDLMDGVKLDANFALAAVTEKKGEIDRALEMYDQLAKQGRDLYNQARARAAAARLRYAKGKIGADAATNILESVRMGWRGDALERSVLQQLATIYTEAKRYDEVLRTYRNILDDFPNDPNSVIVAADMSELFQHIFLDGLDKEMPPLKALSLFYEFRELTPLGDKGDKVIQQLADRLAAIDLLDRATQLLDNQVKFRVSGQERSQIGARLALLHILNHHPQDALDVLETTNFGGNPPELQLQRQELTAEALMKLGKYEEALSVITNDTSRPGNYLRLDILWAMQDWPNVVSHGEDILGARQNLTEPLTIPETEVLLKLALGYTFEGDNIQLRYLRDYYSALIPDSAMKQIFNFITNDTAPLDTQDFDMLTKQISRTESFLDQFKRKIAAGKLSETIK